MYVDIHCSIQLTCPVHRIMLNTRRQNHQVFEVQEDVINEACPFCAPYIDRHHTWAPV
jgi:hypothetical protein